MALQVEPRFYKRENIFAFSLKYLFLVGLWPKDYLSYKQRIMYFIYTVTLHLLTIVLFIITGISLYENRKDLNTFLMNVNKIICGYKFYAKTILFTVNRETIKTLIEEIHNSGDVITEKNNKRMKVTVIVVTGVSLVILSSFSLIAIHEGKMLIEAWMPFNAYESRNNILLSVQILSIVFLPSILRVFAMQALVWTLTMYLCEQLIELQTSIKNLKYTKETELITRKIFQDIIRKHIRVLRYSKTTENIFRAYFMVQNVTLTMEVCLNAVMIAVVTDITHILTLLAFLGLALVNAFIYSYLGDELIKQSQGVALAAYETSWTSWPVDMQKNLLILIRVAQKGLALSAGGIALVSIENFNQVLYNGYSIFAVLYDMVD